MRNLGREQGNVTYAEARQDDSRGATTVVAERAQRSTRSRPLDEHLKRLENEAIHILREFVAQAAAPVMLYSIGKDSSVLLHLARKAFYPSKIPFPLLHIDTTWKFKQMIRFRDETAGRLGLDLRVYTNEAGVRDGINPFDYPSSFYTRIMKTDALKAALTEGRYDAAIGGARRDEERSRAKERVFSIRAPGHMWDPKRQRPEIWRLYNGRLRSGETVRVFPLSNWTELDIWSYIVEEKIPVVSLYLAAERPVVTREGRMIVVDDERMRLGPGERPEPRRVRFRSLGCYPLCAAISSNAFTVEDIVQEMATTHCSERAGRLIDHDEDCAMEMKKREGYF